MSSNQISIPKIHITQISSPQVGFTQVAITQSAPRQISSTQVNSSKISLPSSRSSEQLLSIHSSTPGSVYTLNNSALTFWKSLLKPQAEFDINLQIKDFPTGQLAEAQITKYNSIGRPIGGNLLIDTDANGKGWFIDPTPLDNSEFNTTLSDTAYRASTMT